MGIRTKRSMTSAATGDKPIASETKTTAAREESTSSVVHLTNALVNCDDHLGEVENENLELRVRNAALEQQISAGATAHDAGRQSPTQALEHCGEALSDAQDQNQRLIDSNTSLLGLVRERSDAMEIAQHAANHDVVTDLPNRRMLPKRLRQAIAQARQHQQSFAVVMLDLDGFKHVNDQLGHPAGDRLLQALARRICANLGGGDSVCHYGGVQFVLVLQNISESAAFGIVESIAQQVATPFTVEGHAITVTASTGVALYPRDGRDVARLLQVADKAMCLRKPKRDHALKIQMAGHPATTPPSSL
jgi:diguanylate cyclase (GGDEF)-like protein